MLGGAILMPELLKQHESMGFLLAGGEIALPLCDAKETHKFIKNYKNKIRKALEDDQGDRCVRRHSALSIVISSGCRSLRPAHGASGGSSTAARKLLPRSAS